MSGSCPGRKRTMAWILFLFVAAVGVFAGETNALVAAAQEPMKTYEFGFTIDEQQHRYEKRDENGIVMGEFGFITADGIYHVTVYATDEAGRFRILAMKSYPYESTPKTIEMDMRRDGTLVAAATTTTTTTSGTIDALRSVVEKEMRSKFVESDDRFVFSTTVEPTTATKPTEKEFKTSTYGLGGDFPKVETTTYRGIHFANDPKFTTKYGTTYGSSGSGKSLSRSHGRAGDLYHFNYELALNGHSESGNRDGSKHGRFYSIGADNVERVVEYTANQHGYQPRLRWRKLDSSEVKARTATTTTFTKASGAKSVDSRDTINPLKKYEFKWFTKDN